jgi:hypothetical protein
MIRKSTALLPICLAVLLLAGCASTRATRATFHDPNMDFGLIQNVAVLPFSNMSTVQMADGRVRDVFVTMLQATGAVYVVPLGEVTRAIDRSTVSDPSFPSPEEVVALASSMSVDVVITGTVLEYGEVRAGAAGANIVSISAQMLDGQTGRVVWSSSATRGGVGTSERLFGGGGEPMNIITTDAVDDLLDELFK